MNDSQLDQLLRDCGPALKTPASFRSDVWLRIESADADAWKPGFAGWLRRLIHSLTLPPVALATCAVTILAGSWLGMKTEVPKTNVEMAYVQSISPFAHSAR